MTGVDGFVLVFVELALKATVVLAAGHALALLLRRASASSLHLVWAATVVGALVLVPLVLSVSWRWEVVDLGAVTAAPAARVDLPAPIPEVGPPPPTSSAGPPTAADGGAPPPWDPSALLLALWLAGSAVALVPLVRGMQALRELRRSGEPCTDPELTALALSIRRRLSVPAPRILMSAAVGAPFTTGVLRPAVILPASATAWSRSRKESVLLHELAHVRRLDVVVHLLARAACAVYWFHPLAWSAARRLRSESERACDDHVLRAGSPPSRYASDLLELAQAGGGAAIPSIAPSMARTSDFEGRLLSILDEGRPRRSDSRRTTAAAGLLGLAVACAVAVLGADRAEAAVLQEAGPPEAAAPANGVASALVRLLADPERDVRASAAKALGDRRATAAVDALVASLSDESAAVRRSAAVALGSLKAASAVEPLAAVASGDSQSWVRSAAVWALGETEHEVAVEALARVVDEARDGDLRRDAVRALGETGRPSAARVLEGMLERSRRRTLRVVLAALAELGEAGGYEVLVSVMESDDARLREMAAEALAEAGD